LIQKLPVLGTEREGTPRSAHRGVAVDDWLHGGAVQSTEDGPDAGLVPRRCSGFRERRPGDENSEQALLASVGPRLDLLAPTWRGHLRESIRAAG
jgi:hypothetical protein